MKQKILILGAGVGGLVAANELRKKLSKEHEIIIFEKEENFAFAPSYLWVMMGNRKPHEIQKDYKPLSKKGITVVHGVIDSIDPHNISVSVNGKNYHGDYMIISLGADLSPDSYGLSKAGYNFYTLDGATNFYTALSNISEGKIVLLTAAPAYKCPAAPYEAAMLVEYYLRKKKIRDTVTIDLYAAESMPMAVTGSAISQKVRHIVESRNISYHPEHQIKEVDTENRTLYFNNGIKAQYDLLGFVPVHHAPKVAKDAGLLNDSGWISVDKHSLETKFPKVYAIGDITTIPLKLGKPLPKAGVFAHGQAEVAAHNIACSIKGKDNPKVFEGFGQCFLETGDGKAALGKGNFYAEPLPDIKLFEPGRHWHAAKILFEKDWFRRWF